MQLPQETWLTLRDAGWDGICRPLVSSSELPKTWAKKGTNGKPRRSIAPCSRREGKIQSVGSRAKAAPKEEASCPVQAP